MAAPAKKADRVPDTTVRVSKAFARDLRRVSALRGVSVGEYLETEFRPQVVKHLAAVLDETTRAIRKGG